MPEVLGSGRVGQEEKEDFDFEAKIHKSKSNIGDSSRQLMLGLRLG